MAKQSFAKRMEGELTPVVNGRQYRAKEVAIIDSECKGCAAAGTGANEKALCEALPECGKWKRLDGRNVVFVDCGLAARTEQYPVVNKITGPHGGVRYEHNAFTVGTRWLHKPTACVVEVVDEGMAGMPEVKFEDGHTIYSYPQDLMPITKGGAE